MNIDFINSQHALHVKAADLLSSIKIRSRMVKHYTENYLQNCEIDKLCVQYDEVISKLTAVPVKAVRTNTVTISEEFYK